MARKTTASIKEEEERIVSIIASAPAGKGLSAREIAQRYGTLGKGRVAGRTIRYRLAELIRQGRIRQLGGGRSTVYLAVSPPPPSSEEPAKPSVPPAVAVPTDDAELPVSPEGTALRASIRRPRHLRTPVGYETDLLFSYTPGKSWFLTSAIRARLHELGRTPGAVRPAGTFARDIVNRLLIDLSWASSRLEGNTYTRLDTQTLIEFGQQAEGKDAAEAQMILNHKTAIELMIQAVEDGIPTRRTILELHAALAENLLSDAAGEGRLRTRPVEISGTVYTPTAIPQVVESSFERFVETYDAIPDPFEQSFFAMVHLPYLQPFIDVNKRTSRLVANLPLVRANLCPLSFVDLPERAYVEAILAIYEERRTELLRDVYVWAYERSRSQYIIIRDSLPEPDPVRLRYRAQLHEIVADVVAARALPERSDLRERAAARGIAKRDQDAVAQRALELLLALNEGSAVRYRIRIPDYREWKAAVSAATKR